MIFYFSGTGNTKWAVEKLAEKTGDRRANEAQTTKTLDRKSVV